MTDSVFHNQYWKQYIMIEKEFKTSIKYVEIDESNFPTYSDVYAKLLLQIGSEVDVVAKLLCKELNSASSAGNILDYQSEIYAQFPKFGDVKVECNDIELIPWDGLATTSPVWWKVYNGVKHNRNVIATYGSETKENYKFANQENVLNALAGLYQLEQYLYAAIPHSQQQEETPLPGSRLFKLGNQGWENKHFGQDSLFFDKEGRLYHLYAGTAYSDI